METNNIPISKIVSILVAVVVTAGVLIPICNELGGDDNESGNGRSSEYINPGQWMYKLDPSDSGTTINLDDVEVGGLAVIADSGSEFTEIAPKDIVYKKNQSTFWSTTIPPFVEDLFGLIYTLRLIYDPEEESWAIVGNESSIEEAFIRGIETVYAPIGSGERFWAYSFMIDEYQNNVYADNNWTYYAAGKGWKELGSDEVHFWGSEGSEEWRFEYVKSDGVHYIDSDDVNLDRYNLVCPEFTIGEDSKLNISRTDVQFDADGEHYTIGNIRMVAITPHSVQIENGGNSDDSDKGIAGTLIQFIPVFVALSILGAVAYMVVGRKDDEIIE